MTDEPLAQQLTTLRGLLDEVDTRLARAPVAPAGLEDLKRSVDALRTNIWAVMSAGYGARAEERVRRFRLRRAIDTLRGVSDELAATPGTPLLQEHVELQLVAKKVVEQIGALR